MLTRLLDQSFVQGMLEFVFPPLCGGCGEYCNSTTGVCEQCLARIDWYLSPFELSNDPADLEHAAVRDSSLRFPLFAGGDYTDPLKRMVIQFKFHGVLRLSEIIADRIVEAYGEQLNKLRPFALLPIPLHPGREYARGYNQALVFAKSLATRLEVNVADETLVRGKRRRPQASLRQAERESNIRGVFEAVESPEDSGAARLMLVDDVVTSGSTAREARRALQEADYHVLGAISMAHGV